MNCIIVDDQADARKVLHHFCELSEAFDSILDFDNSVKAFNYLQQNEVDILFLDIHMPELSGMDLLKAMAGPVNVVFTTSDQEYAAEAFEHNAIDYLIKPFTYARFLKAVNRAQYLIEMHEKVEQKPMDASNALFVKDGSKLVKLAIEDIFFIEAQGDYVNIHTEKKNFLIHSTMKNIEEKLPSEHFFKVHRSYIVNLHHIDDIEESILQVNKFKVPISKAKKDELLKQLRVI